MSKYEILVEPPVGDNVIVLANSFEEADKVVSDIMKLERQIDTFVTVKTVHRTRKLDIKVFQLRSQGWIAQTYMKYDISMLKA